MHGDWAFGCVDVEQQAHALCGPAPPPLASLLLLPASPATRAQLSMEASESAEGQGASGGAQGKPEASAGEAAVREAAAPEPAMPSDQAPGPCSAPQPSSAQTEEGEEGSKGGAEQGGPKAHQQLRASSQPPAEPPAEPPVEPSLQPSQQPPAQVPSSSESSGGGAAPAADTPPSRGVPGEQLAVAQRLLAELTHAASQPSQEGPGEAAAGVGAAAGAAAQAGAGEAAVAGSGEAETQSGALRWRVNSSGGELSWEVGGAALWAGARLAACCPCGGGCPPGGPEKRAKGKGQVWETHSQTIRSDNWRDFRKKCLFQCGGPEKTVCVGARRARLLSTASLSRCAVQAPRATLQRRPAVSRPDGAPWPASSPSHRRTALAAHGRSACLPAAATGAAAAVAAPARRGARRGPRWCAGAGRRRGRR
jgi:hypothetical protein